MASYGGNSSANGNQQQQQRPQFVQEYKLNLKNQLITANQVENIINPLINRINANRRLYFGNNGEEIPEYRVGKLEYFRQAFTHKSFILEQANLVETGRMKEYSAIKQGIGGMGPESAAIRAWIKTGQDTIDYNPVESNERLEYLGDSFIKSTQATYLFKRYPGKPGENNEGFMTSTRIKLEQTKRLAEFAKHLQFDKYMLISDYLDKLEHKEQGRNNPKFLENVFEAFIGALICDHSPMAADCKLGNGLPTFSGIGQGYAYVYFFMTSVMEECIVFEELVLKNDNFKDSLLRYLVSKKWRDLLTVNSEGKQQPFEDIYYTGQPNDRIYTIATVIDDCIVQQLPPEQKQKIADYQIMMTDKIIKSAPECCIKLNELLQAKRWIIGIGIEKTKIKAQQLASKFALHNLNVKLNF